MPIHALCQLRGLARLGWAQPCRSAPARSGTGSLWFLCRKQREMALLPRGRACNLHLHKVFSRDIGTC